MRYRNGFQKSFKVLVPALAVGAVAGCGQAIPLSTEGLLGDAVITGTGGTRVDGSDIGNIYSVTTVIQATAGNPYATTAELPFTGTAAAIGSPVTDGQTPFHFDFGYPANNYKLAEAHIVIDTQRDSSDTEGIFVDGIFTGRPPLSMVNSSSPRIQYATYAGNTAGYAANTYYIDFAIAHYKQMTRNTYDLNIDQLLAPTTVKTLDLVKDGHLPVVTGDDSEVFQGFLVLKGYTISKAPLTCSNSPTYTFQNVFLHNDGNSIGTAAFTGTVDGAFTSWGASQTGFQSVEFYYDEQLPRVSTANITLTSSSIALSVKRTTSAYATSAIVINGVGVAEPGFDKTLATAAVESWTAGSPVTYWSSWAQAIPADGAAHTVTLDLLSLLGASQLRTLLAQGKLNISIAGSLGMVQASNNTSSRGAGAPVTGPELSIAGTYYPIRLSLTAIRFPPTRETT
jgi:hypothetical protein